MKDLTRFWFRFESLPQHSALSLGCGVTAYNYDDAIALLSERVFGTQCSSSISECIEDLNVSTLDAKHVLPNMGNVLIRGIWFPLGYEVS